MPYLALARHGESTWNRLQVFTGPTDVGLTDTGREQARKGASLLRDIHFDHAYTSNLRRASESLQLTLEYLNIPDISITVAPEIRERDYGDLVWTKKEDSRKKFGDELFLKYRRGWDTRPPNGESLKDVAERTIPYFNKHILPDLLSGKNVLVVAHGNSIRSMIKHLENLSPEEISQTELDVGEIYVYQFDRDGKIIGKEIRSPQKN